MLGISRIPGRTDLTGWPAPLRQSPIVETVAPSTAGAARNAESASARALNEARLGRIDKAIIAGRCTIKNLHCDARSVELSGNPRGFQPMKQFLNAIVEAGVRSEMSAREARFVKASNIIALITVVWLILLLPMIVQYLPAVRNVIVVSVSCAIGLCFVPVINSFGFYRTAQIYAATISMCTVAFNALHLGHESWNDLLLLAGILVSFYYVESLSTLMWITVFGLGLFAGVEGWYASGRQGLLEGVAPDQFFVVVKNTSVYSLVVLTIGFAYYNRAVLNSTQRALDRESARSESLLLNILPKTPTD
jgi:hypothetical protein